MPEYLAPGVYVEEVDTGAKPIEGVSTSTAGMVGITERGPENVPTLVTGYADFVRQFGRILNRRTFTGGTWYLPHAIKGFFDNGGKRVYVVRVLPQTATYAQTLLFDHGTAAGGVNTRLAVSAPKGATALLVEDGTSITDETWLRLDNGLATEFIQASIPSTAPLPNRAARALRSPLNFNHAGGPSSPVVVLPLNAVPGPNDLATHLSADASAGETRILLESRTHVQPGSILRIGPTTLPSREYVRVAAVPSDPSDLSVTLNASLAYQHVGTGGSPEEVVLVEEGAATATSQLNQDATAGMTVIVIDNAGGSGADFDPGDIVRIGGATDQNREYHVVADVLNVGNRAPVSYALFNPARASHSLLEPVQVVTLPNATGGAAFDEALSADAEAGSLTVTLADRTGLAKNDIVRIGSGMTQEFQVIASIPTVASDQTVTFTQPLTFAHPGTGGTPDHVVRVTRTAGANATTLLRMVRQGDSSILVADNAGLGTNPLVEIGAPGSANVEYATLGNAQNLFLFTVASLAGLSASGGLLSNHTTGAPLLSRSPLLRVQAIDRGEWGDCLRIRVEDDSPLLETTAAANLNPASATLVLASTVQMEVGSVVDVDYPGGTAQRKVIGINGKTITLDNNHMVSVPAGTKVRTREFRLTVECLQPGSTPGSVTLLASETHRWLSMDPRHSRYAPLVIGSIYRSDATTPKRADGRTEGESDLIRVEDFLADTTTGMLSPAAETTAETTLRLGPDLIWDFPSPNRRVSVGQYLTGGDDAIGLVDDNTYIGTDDVNPIDRTGLFALKNIDEIAVVAIPGRTSQLVQQELITHCELMRYRFAVLDSIPGNGVAEVQEQRGLYDSKYAALYYPWLRIIDPFPDNPRTPGTVLIPPSGHMIGIYARSDNERGVHKAPANEVIRGIDDLEFKLTKEEQDILNPRNINVLRDFRDNNRGLRVWGARTISSDPDWKYVNVRRLFIFIEHSIDNGTQWVVFEPNADPLWERVRRVVISFLTNVWRDGALMGRTPAEAFYVKADRTTMTQYDIDNGRLIVLVGVAPTKPAEFVIFRIGQWAGGSDLSEG